MIFPIVRLRNGHLILKNVMLKKKKIVTLSKKKNYGAEGIIVILDICDSILSCKEDNAKLHESSTACTIILKPLTVIGLKRLTPYHGCSLQILSKFKKKNPYYLIQP